MAARQGERQTAKELRKAVEAYWNSISRTVEVTESVPTGEVDEKGRAIVERKPVYNDKGEVIHTREYLIPPTLTGLCLHLGITPEVWKQWCDHQAHPELEWVTEWVNAVMQAWNEQQLLTRKDVKGIMFHLQNNFGYTQKVEVEAREQMRQAQALTTQEKLALLQELWEGGGQMKLPHSYES